MILTSQNVKRLDFVTKKIASTQDTIQIDTLSVVPNSFQIYECKSNKVIDSSQYKFDNAKSELIWLAKPSNDSLCIDFQTFPFNLNKSYSNKKYETVSKDNQAEKPFLEYKVKAPLSELFAEDGMTYNGSFSRGISVGNRQDLSVNSNLNLQFAGTIGKDIEVIGSLNDNNIPFQTQGNTQQLQDFDKIFIQLRKGNHQLILGDFSAEERKSHFLTFNKKLQGINYSSHANFGKNSKFSTNNSFAIARGRYHRLRFFGEDGNQGPYKLTGADGETFIIVLSGTERIYLEGQLLTRGSDQDYVIDYNLGEIYFTPNQIITQDLELVIEYEYSQRYYLRSLLHHQSKIENEKLSVRLNVYSEQDAKNQSGLQELSDSQKSLLSDIGDDLDKAIVSSEATAEPDDDRVLYQKQDTTDFNGQPIEYFVKSDSTDADLFAVSFSNVGLNNGQYQLAQSTLNGRVYEFVGRDNAGNPQGSYDPVVQIFAPEKKQYLSLAADYKLSNKTNISTELSVSNEDVNTFSRKDDKDDIGAAGLFKIDHTEKISSKKNITLKAFANYEWRNEPFRFLQDYRSVRFKEVWNVKSNNIPTNEHLLLGGFELNFNKKLSLKYEAGFFDQAIGYNSIKNKISSTYRNKGYSIEAIVDLVNSKDPTEESYFNRYRLNASKQFDKLGKWTLGFNSYLEENKFTLMNTKQIQQNSLGGNQFEVFIKSPLTSKNQYYLSYFRRYDFAPFNNDLAEATMADMIKFKGKIQQNSSSQLNWNFTYRNLKVDTLVTKNQTSKQTLLGLVDYQLVLFKGFIKSNTSYEVSSGQQQKIEYFYSPVQANLGDYIWLDNNMNGLQENNEFQLASNFNLEDSIRYVRIIIPSNEYEQTSKVMFNQSFNINPKAKWFSEDGWKKIVSKFTIQSLWQVDRQYRGDQRWEQYSPFYNNDSVLVSANSSTRNAIFYNRTNPNFNLQLFINNFQNKTLLIGGTDERKRREMGLKSNYKLFQNVTGTFTAQSGFNNNFSKAFENRDYQIDFFEIQPKIIYRKGLKFRSSLEVKEKRQTNNLDLEMDKAVLERSISAEAGWNNISKSSFSSKLSYINIRYENSAKELYPQNTAAAFQLLQGLNPGTNWVWNLNIETEIMKNVQFVVQYTGKKSKDVPVSHLGNVQVRAVF